MSVIGNKIRILDKQFDNGMSAVADLDHFSVVDRGANIIILCGNRCKRAINIKLCKKGCRRLYSRSGGGYERAHLREQIVFKSGEAVARAQHG